MMRGTTTTKTTTSMSDEFSSDDDSSDIRTVRTNTTNVFSQTSTYYTNPTLPPPPPHSIVHNHHEDDQTTLTDDVLSLDYTSPTSIMTNYESYSKFGAAPIYQNVIIPTTNAQRRALSLLAQQQQQQQQSSSANSTTLTSGKPELLLKTIVEEQTTAISPTKVYHPPSYYKTQRRSTSTPMTTTDNTTTTTTTGSNAPILSVTTKSLDDGSIMTDNVTSSSASRSSTTTTGSSSVNPTTTIIPNTKESTILSVTIDQKKPVVVTPTSPPSTTAFAIFKRMTASVGNSPLRNRSQTSSPIPPPAVSSSSSHQPGMTVPNESGTLTTVTQTTKSTNSSSNHLDPHHGAKNTTTTTTSNQPQPTRSLRNYMNTLAYKSRQRSSPNSIPSSGRVTPPPSKKANHGSSSTGTPVSPTTSMQSATSTTSSSGPSKNAFVAGTGASTQQTTQELITTPIKSNSSTTGNIMTKKNDLVVLEGNRSVDSIPHEIMTKNDNNDTIATKKKTTATTTCPTTTSTITSTLTDGSGHSTTTTPYSNPILKSVSSKLFSPSEEDDDDDAVVVITSPQAQQRTVSPVPVRISETAVIPKEYDTAPKARLNLELVDRLATMEGTAKLPSDPQQHHPKESFRLWTDEDSAFGTSWYSFTTSAFDDTNNTSMESNLSASGGDVTMSNVTSQPSTAHPHSGAILTMPPEDPNQSSTKTMIAPQCVTTIPPSVIPPSGKLSLSLLQLKNLHRTSSIGSTDDDGDTTHQYPSMVSSEFEDEGGTSTLCSGTLNNPTDDCTTLGGGASFDFSVSACVDDDESLKKKEAGMATTPVVQKSRSNPIVYSNVGQAFSRYDVLPSKSMYDTSNNNNSNIDVPPKAGSRLIPPGPLSVVDRPQRRRSSSTGKLLLLSSPSSLEVIEEHVSHDHHTSIKQLPENSLSTTSEPNPNNTAVDTMVVLSLAESIASSNKKDPNSSQGSDPTVGNNNQGKIKVIRKLDSIQIGIILLISVALAAVLCATFCIVGSCQVSTNKNNRALAVNAVVPRFETVPIQPTHYLRTSKHVDTISTLMIPP